MPTVHTEEELEGIGKVSNERQFQRQMHRKRSLSAKTKGKEGRQKFFYTGRDAVRTGEGRGNGKITNKRTAVGA